MARLIAGFVILAAVLAASLYAAGGCIRDGDSACPTTDARAEMDFKLFTFQHIGPRWNI
jgi:hypothetical protein